MARLDAVFDPLKGLVGTWKAHGRTFDADRDNIFGEVTVEPILDGAYLQVRARMKFKDGMIDFPSIEIIRYNAATQHFPSVVFAKIGEGPGGVSTDYEWYAEHDGTIVHRGAGAIYRGSFSEDGMVLDGGWRPEDDEDTRDEASYDLTMIRM